jgi:hypothetical protein
MSPEAPFQVVLRVLTALEALGARYHVGGSFASSIHGTPRFTHDLDVVVTLSPLQASLLAQELREEFYLDLERLQEAVAGRRSCNLIHLATGFKVDLFVSGTSPFDRSEMARAVPMNLFADASRTVPVKSAEDLVLRKLLWYREGGGVSDRQWHDILGVLRQKRGSLDMAYVERWSTELGLGELLEKALRDASS